MNQISVCAGKRALVVEDNALVSFMMQDMLEDLGCAIAATAGTLDQAVQLAHSAEIDFAILDLNIDGVVSYPVADALVTRGIPFVFASGYATAKLPERLADAGRIGKPFVAQELLHAIEAALGDGTVE